MEDSIERYVDEVMREEHEEEESRKSDTAYDIHQIGLSRPRKPFWENFPILEDVPFVVIGNFAYLIGYDGSLWQAPYHKPELSTKRARVFKLPFMVHWDEAVEVTESTPSAVFPLERLKNVISDLQNITDIMHQHGVKTETDK